jgi:hypothetical protein
VPYLDLNLGAGSLTGTTTFTQLSAVSGDTLTVRSLGGGQHAKLMGLGSKHATAGMVRLTSPFLADAVNGIRSRTLSVDGSSVIDMIGLQKLRGQDPLDLASTGGSSAEEVTAWVQVYYDELNGGPSLYITLAELQQRVIEYVTLESPTTCGASGAWGTAALSAGVGILKADQVYAIVGYELDVACTAVAVLGPDTGNFKAGGPGITTRQFTRRYFADMSAESGLPTIPCFNAQNASGTFTYAADSAGATAVNVDLILARLRS